MYQTGQPVEMRTSRPADLEMHRLGIVIVHYRTPQRLEQLLEALAQQAFPGPIAIVDTSEEDQLNNRIGSFARLPGMVQFLARRDNPGFGAAANLGLTRLPELPYYAICNADVVPQPGALAALVQFLVQHPRAGLVGPRILDPEGLIEPSWGMPVGFIREIVYRLRTQRMHHRILQRYWNWWLRRPRQVTWVTGACFVVRREAWTATGGFDPAYFLYYEDCDLGLRASALGWEVWLVPEARVMHYRGASIRQSNRGTVARRRRESQWYYYGKHRPGWERRALALYFHWRGVPIPPGSRFDEGKK